MTRMVLAFIAGSALTAVCLLSVWQAPTSPMICRPSAPAAAAAAAVDPVVLFWGNSLAHDADWNTPGRVLAINCARQGQTATEALAEVKALPDIEPAAIVLAFGTVELVRQAADVPQFSDTMRALTAALRDRYPAARLALTGIPATSAPWRYDTDQAARLNTVLAALGPDDFLDLDAALAGVPEAMQSYDGVHLSPTSYTAWRKALHVWLDRP